MEYLVTDKQLLLAIKDIEKSTTLSVDTETTGLNPLKDKLLLVQIGIDGKTYVIDARKVSLEPTRHVFESKKYLKILHNAKFDYKFLYKHCNISINKIFDTKVAEMILKAGIITGSDKNIWKATSLKTVANKYCDIDLDKSVVKGFIGFSLDGEFSEEQLNYAAEDVIVLPEIKERQTQLLKQYGLLGIAELDFAVIRPVARMELLGFKLDSEKWKISLDKTKSRLFEVVADLRQVLPDPPPPPKKEPRFKKDGTLFKVDLNRKDVLDPVLNLDSWQQVVKAFSVIDVDLELANKKTKAGLTNGSTLKFAAKVYQKNQLKNRTIKKFLEYRKLKQIEKNFGDNLISWIADDGRIHAEFHPNGTVSGRFSSSSPNLQNIPKMGEEGKILRSCFIPEEGNKFVIGDYSQIELRIAAELSKDMHMIHILNDPRGDIHKATASTMYGVPYDQVTPEQRNAAKCVVGSTHINTNKGLLRIDGISNNREKDTFKKVDGLSTYGGNVLNQYYNSVQDTIKLKTTLGYEIEGTKKHKIKVMDESGTIVWKKLEDVKVGDWLVQRLGENNFGTDVELPEVFVGSVTNCKPLNIPKKLDEKLSRWLGYYVSEGYLNKHKTKPNTGSVVIGVSSNNDLLNDLVSISREIFGRVIVQKHNKYTIVSIHSGLLCKFLDALSVGRLSTEKAIPDIIFRTSRTNQINFIRALFAGDGCKSHSNYSSSSETLIKQLQQLLSNFGIQASIAKTKSKLYPKNTNYLLRPFGKKSNSIWWSIIYNSDRTIKYDYSIIPNQTERLKDLLSHLHGYALEKCREVLRDKSPIRLNHSRLSMIIDNISGDKSYLEYLNSLDFVKVSEKVSGKAEVFDLELDGSHEYVANSFVTHNTLNFGIIYGMTVRGLADKLGCSDSEALKLYNQYKATYNTLFCWIDEEGTRSFDRGYAKTLAGRIRWFPTLNYNDPEYRKKKAHYERVGKNHPIQACSADMNKLAIVLLFDPLLEYYASIVNTIHDELCVESPINNIINVAQLVKDKMVAAGEKFLKQVPVLVDVKIRDCWWKDDGVDDNENGQQLIMKELISV